MKIKIEPGKYVVAVSGGMDSMVLLDLLSKMREVELVVANFNHGIRVDSAIDEELVALTTHKLDLPFEVGYGRLASTTSEAASRAARYKFLEKVRQKYGAKAIITAHHQDDLIETAIINLLRGTGWRGLVAIMRSPGRVRPLLGISKKQLLSYAKANKLSWHEDKTNTDPKYLRNRVRTEIVPKLTAADRRQLLDAINRLADGAPELEDKLSGLSAAIKADGVISRRAFAALPTTVGNELLLSWLKEAGAKDSDRRQVARLSLAIKSAPAGTRHNAGGKLWLEVGPASARLL